MSVSLLNRGFLFAIASTVLFSIRPIFVKLVYVHDVSPLDLIVWRMIFSMPIYLGILCWLLRDQELRARLTLRNTALSAFVGLFGYYLASYLDLLGLQYVTTQLGRMVLYAYPTLVVVFAAILFRERITLNAIVSLLITYAGVLVIFGHDLQEFGSDVIKGSLLIFACAVSFAFYMIFAKPLIQELGSRLFTSIALISASLAIFIHSGVDAYLTNENTLWNVNQYALFWIVVIALFCTVIPTFLTTAAIGSIGPERAGIVAMIGPGFTSLFAVLILSEAFTLYHLLGVSLGVIGVWYLHRGSRKESL